MYPLQYLLHLTIVLPCFININDPEPFRFSDLKKQFEKYPEDTRVQFGQHAELHCVPPAGVPPPVVYWMRGNQKVEQDTTVVISSEGDLVIGQARPQDSGNYTCVAENIAAKRMAPPVQITVVGKSTIIR